MKIFISVSLLVRFTLFTLALFTLTGCAGFPFFSGSPSRQFGTFVQEYFDGKYSVAREPSVRHAWMLTDADSLDAVGAARALERLRTIDTTALSIDERLDWLQIEASLKRDIRDTILHGAETSPGQYLTVGGLFWRVEGERVPSEKEWNEMLATLSDAPEVMRLGRRQLVAPPPLWVRLAVNTAKRYEDFLAGRFTEKVAAAAPESLQTPLREAADEAVLAMQHYRTFLADTLVPGGESSWEVGEEYYNWLLREYHFLPYSAATMIEAGRRAHEETKAAMRELGKKIDPAKTVHELIEDLKSRHPEPYKITDAYHAESDRVRRLIVEKNLVRIPLPETLLFVPTPPSIRETYAWGGYGGIEMVNGVPGGRFFVTDIVPEMTPEAVEEKLRAQNNGWVTVIALHEGYPGHHLQSLYSRENNRPVRRWFGSTYYGEGWALFAESWMARSGYYENADDSLAWLQMRLWRTARVIIDPSLHTGRMTYEEAVQFMVDEVGLERSAAEAEVNRYTTWPTQAPSYIIGWLEIEELKKEIVSREGASFNEKKFVETVLEAGSLPLELMKRAVRSKYAIP